jgi:hypothetical protein
MIDLENLKNTVVELLRSQAVAAAINLSSQADVMCCWLAVIEPFLGSGVVSERSSSKQGADDNTN